MRTPWILLLLGLLVAACSPDFDRVSDVYDLRVLGVKMTPPEYVYTITFDDQGEPAFDPASLATVPSFIVTILVANPAAPERAVDYRVEGCLLDDALDCVVGSEKVLFGKGQAAPGVIDVEISLTPELIMKSFAEDPFFGLFGAAVWLSGEVVVDEQRVPFLKAFALVPDYGQGRTANANPIITGLLAGEEDEEEPMVLDEAGSFHVGAGEKTRILPEFPEGTRETYVVKALDLEGLEFQAEASFQTVFEQAYDKEITEELTLFYFTTCGRFEDDSRTEAIFLAFETEEDKNEKDLGTTWTAPDEPGSCSIWLVANDGRGGIGWLELPVVVE